MIVLICIALGIALRLLSGRRLSEIGSVGLRGEMALIVLLAAQLALPSVRLAGAERIGYYAWLGTFPCIIVIAWANRRAPGMAMLGLGLLLNFAVIASNGGMPVFSSAALIAKPGLLALTLPTGDFVHVVGTVSTRLPWLGDVIPIPGPSWLRSVASAGDLLLFAGIVVFLGAARGHAGEGRAVDQTGIASVSGNSLAAAGSGSQPDKMECSR